MSAKSERKRRIYQEKRAAELASITPNDVIRKEREGVKRWYPTADMLSLPYVPEDARSQIRSLLAGTLAEMKARKFPIVRGQCWRTSQILTMVAKSERVQYVEGVWKNCDCCGSVIHHAWNIVNGYIVDLSEEFYVWQDPDDKPAPEREPHTIFKFEEVAEYYDNYVGEFDPDAWDIISREYWLCDGGLNALPSHLQEKKWNWSDEEYGEVNAVHFKPAFERLQARVTNTASVRGEAA